MKNAPNTMAMVTVALRSHFRSRSHWIGAVVIDVVVAVLVVNAVFVIVVVVVVVVVAVVVAVAAIVVGDSSENVPVVVAAGNRISLLIIMWSLTVDGDVEGVAANKRLKQMFRNYYDWVKLVNNFNKRITINLKISLIFIFKNKIYIHIK